MKTSANKRVWVRVATLVCLLATLTAPSFVYAASSAALATQSFRSTLVELVNNDRISADVAPLVPSALLTQAAQKKADDMAAQGYFAHYSPRGTSPWHWLTAVGYYYTHAGENLAIHFDDPAALEAAWMSSPTHRANIVRGIYTEIGVGVARGTYRGRPTNFIVQLLAAPALI